VAALPVGPRTFAEAAMSTRRSRQFSTKDNSDPVLAKAVSLESLGPFRYTFKKKKKASKWAPFDLGAADSASESGALGEMESFSRLPSPELVTSTSTSTTTTVRRVSTSTPNQLPASALTLSMLQDDPQSTEREAGETMASSIASANLGRDKDGSSNSFESVEWDPDLPSASGQRQYTEPPAAAVQPIAYTTVGSIVNPHATPQFTAPNRVQREGSGRRRLLSLMQSRQHDSFYPNRGHSPLNMASGLQHAHQIVHSPNRFNLSHTPPPHSTRSMRPARSLQRIGSLTEQEKSILTKIQGPTAPHIFSGNLQSSSAAAAPSSNYPMAVPNITKPASCAKDSVQEEDRGRFTTFQGPNQGPAQVPAQGPAQGPVQGLEKMQTLQRLAKFENPMQSLALSRLSEFSVSKPQGVATTLDNPTLAIGELLRIKDQSSAATAIKAEESSPKAGELDRTYRFPLPSIVDSSKPQANPLFGAFSPSTMKSSKDPSLHQPGYPAPLTAGPPGQRQYQGTASKVPAGYYPGNLWGSDLQPSGLNPCGGANVQSDSLWSDSYNTEQEQQLVQKSVVPSHCRGGCNSFIQDTAALPVVSKYYPRGLPADMTGHVVPLPYGAQRKMGEIPADHEHQTAEEKAAKKAEELDNWFYSGQRRFAAMSAHDHILEYEERQLDYLNPFGPIAAGSKKPLPPTKKAPLSIEDSKKMSVVEAAAPLLDSAFGSLLTYATQINAPDSARVLSKFEFSPAGLLDPSENGNKSFYGADCGAPPKRGVGDPTYQ
jgi:hypothetical protein